MRAPPPTSSCTTMWGWGFELVEPLAGSLQRRGSQTGQWGCRIRLNPFPGPGLQFIGDITKDRLDLLRDLA